MEHAHHAHAMRSWTDLPLLKTKAGGESRERVIVVPQNIVADAVDAYSNKLADENGRRRLPLDMAGAKLDKPASGGFHWLAAREEQGDEVRVASAVYYFGERGAENPTDMFITQKHELEIVPQPYPREHSRYRANEDWKFLVRFQGHPVVGQMVALETQNGTKSVWVSDAQGVVTVHLPDDFNAETDGKEIGGSRGMGMRGSDFVLAARRADGGKTYLTAFNAAYGKNAFDQRSIVMGLGFTLLGMLGAVPLLRQRRKKNDMPEQPEQTEQKEEA
ncbi:MAG: hypothetical protein A2063_04340 [Gallionellales bacterium GWA2_60_142]|nr:MAG: hypothetical protein A2063_04340 [Gallionellales bacterium GWA2_60_142]